MFVRSIPKKIILCTNFALHNHGVGTCGAAVAVWFKKGSTKSPADVVLALSVPRQKAPVAMPLARVDAPSPPAVAAVLATPRGLHPVQASAAWPPVRLPLQTATRTTVLVHDGGSYVHIAHVDMLPMCRPLFEATPIKQQLPSSKTTTTLSPHC